MEYSDLIREGASTTDIQRYLRGGNQVAFTIRIPQHLKSAAAEMAELRGMSFSAFVRHCMIQELTKRG